jgi:hypothetical protein
LRRNGRDEVGQLGFEGDEGWECGPLILRRLRDTTGEGEMAATTSTSRRWKARAEVWTSR